VDAQLRELRRLIDADLAAFNAMLREVEVPAVMRRAPENAMARAAARQRRHHGDG
jgi:hypothetical protein